MKNILILFLLLTSVAYSQSYTLSVQQDPKLLFVGDGQTNKSSTLNLLIKAGYDFDSFNKDKTGFWSARFGFEYADLRTTYQRYSFGANYNLKLTERLTGSLGYDLGLTYRGSDKTRANNPQIKYITQSVNGVLKFKVIKNINITATGQLVDRRDYYFWSTEKYDSKLIFSTFGGIEILFN